MIVLDTDHLGEFQKGTTPAASRLRTRLEACDDPVATTIVNLEEVMRGWLAAIHRESDPRRQIRGYQQLQILFHFFGAWQILPWDEGAAQVFGRLRAAKLRVGTMDLKIGSIALCRSATLLTRNLRDFQSIPGLTVQDWLSGD